MQIVIAAIRVFFTTWFHQRNIIVVSERKVKHIPISGTAQFIAVVLLSGGFIWAAYSTGSFLATRHTLKAQAHTLRTIANARIDSNFGALNPAAPLAGTDTGDTMAASLSNPMMTLSPLDNNRLFARVAFLQQRVNDLQEANAGIIQRVREKTSGRIEDLESIIKQTGLNPEALKKQAGEKKALKSKRSTESDSEPKSEGGPYIPADMSEISVWENELYADLDELTALRRIVGVLPLGVPMEHSEQQSPFGHRIDPFTRHLAFHSGLDLSGPSGSKVYSTANGKVTLAERDGAYGNAVDVSHGFGLSTRYAHLSQILVKPGQLVKRGDPIGIQGSTGRSTGNHLHYEVRHNDQPMNPKNFLKAGASYVSQE